MAESADPYVQLRADLSAVRAELTAQNMLTATLQAKLQTLEHDVERIERSHQDYVGARELGVKFDAVTADVDDIKMMLAESVSKAEFAPVRNAVFGMIATIMTLIITGLVVVLINGEVPVP